MKCKVRIWSNHMNWSDLPVYEWIHEVSKFVVVIFFALGSQTQLSLDPHLNVCISIGRLNHTIQDYSDSFVNIYKNTSQHPVYDRVLLTYVFLPPCTDLDPLYRILEWFCRSQFGEFLLVRGVLGLGLGTENLKYLGLLPPGPKDNRCWRLFDEE